VSDRSIAGPRVVAWRTALLILLALPIVLVGPSRLYRGQHWLSDVVGGCAVAALLLIPSCWLYACLRPAWQWRTNRVTGALTIRE
jgi:membrane-associated phospholipid phosphatase